MYGSGKDESIFNIVSLSLSLPLSPLPLPSLLTISIIEGGQQQARIDDPSR